VGGLLGIALGVAMLEMGREKKNNPKTKK